MDEIEDGLKTIFQDGCHNAGVKTIRMNIAESLKAC